MSNDADIRIHVACKNILGEGPLWDVEEQRLYWIDSFGNQISRCTADGTEIESWDVPAKIGSMALRRNSGAVLSLQTGFHVFDFKTGECALIHDPEVHLPGTRLNDGKVDRHGRFVAGSMDMDEAGPNGALYRLDPDLSVHVLESGIICSNGPCWSPDGKTFYFTDTWSKEISAYDYGLLTGTLTNKRRFASFEEIGGAPDGATVDAEGFVWSAAVYSGQIVRFAPDGSIDRIIKMPVLNATSVNFGGPKLDVLYVTSMARPPLPRFPEDGPMAGHLFAIHGLGVRGLPEPRFLG
ncbi:SMP-30/gluconolactonase/LRE family protein [Lichenicoccus sp.]|uniref:SMP-30/gluconolactonase/LRE family protein n=1 Tax=Lichenicoccus sp. TaxID=2781899 RepID=UPI003D101337